MTSNNALVPISNNTLVPTNRSLIVYKPTPMIRQGLDGKDSINRLSERAEDEGIRRPKNWPNIMMWPPRSLREALAAGKVSASNRERFQEYYDRYADKTVERANRIHEYLKVNSSSNEDWDRLFLFKKKRRFKFDEGAIHHHIGWASMLDPHGDNATIYEKSVISWGRETMTMADGGRIKNVGDRIQVSKLSEDAIKMMVAEAAARGWETLEIFGDRKFVQGVQALAKSYNIRVEGRVLSNPLSIFGSRIESNPTPSRDREAAAELGALRQSLAEGNGHISHEDPNGPGKEKDMVAEPSSEPNIPMG